MPATAISCRVAVLPFCPSLLAKIKSPRQKKFQPAYRFYEPNFQRWLNRDPIEELGGYNLYEFVRNNPFRFVDSLGFQGIINYDPSVHVQTTPDYRDIYQAPSQSSWQNTASNPDYSKLQQPQVPAIQESNPNAFLGNPDYNGFFYAFGSSVFNQDALDAANDLVYNNLFTQTVEICKNARKPGPNDALLQFMHLYGGFLPGPGSVVADFAGKMSNNPNVDTTDKALNAAAEITLDKAFNYPKEKTTDILREEMYK